MCRLLTLESTFLGFPVAGESDLWGLVAEQFDNHLVDDIAHLVIATDQFAAAVTDTASLIGHKGVAGRILQANITIDAAPTLVAFAIVARSHGPVAAAGQRAAN